MLTVFFLAFLAIVVVRHLFFWRPMDLSYFYQEGHLKLGHRGSPNVAPENTIPSLLKALEEGLTALEIDVLCTKDNRVVCSHNHDLERETDGMGYIHEKTYAELTGVDAGVKFPQFSPSPIPLLEDVFDAIPENIILDIEIKSRGALDIKTAKYVAEIIKRRNLSRRVMVSSFHPLVIGRIKWIDRKIPTAYIWENQYVPNILKKPRFINLVHPDILHPDVFLMNERLMVFVRRKGLRVHPWTVNNQPSIEWLLKLGVDGIFSDFPELMHQAVENIGGLHVSE